MRRWQWPASPTKIVRVCGERLLDALAEPLARRMLPSVPTHVLVLLRHEPDALPVDMTLGSGRARARRSANGVPSTTFFVSCSIEPWGFIGWTVCDDLVPVPV